MEYFGVLTHFLTSGPNFLGHPSRVCLHVVWVLKKTIDLSMTHLTNKPIIRVRTSAQERSVPVMVLCDVIDSWRKKPEKISFGAGKQTCLIFVVTST